MAEIKPIKAWRYNTELSKNIGELTSPLFDVVSNKQRKKLYESPNNSIHLSVPLGNGAADNAALLLQQWKKDGTIIQDPIPGIYVYYQYFTLHGSTREYCRKGFICNIKAYDWSDGTLLRHENTMPHSVNDRITLLEKTQLNVSPTHGLYSDPENELEKYMDEAMLNPIYETEDYQGVKDVLSVIHDLEVIKKFVNHIARRKIILADGHHRYEGSLEYRKTMMAANPSNNGSEGYHYHMMYLTNADSDDLKVLPTHRLIKGMDSFNEQELLDKLSQYFTIKEIEDAFAIDEVILGKKWAFGLLFKDSTYKLRLKPEAIEQLDWPFPDEVRKLDLTVLHYFIIEKSLGIPGHKHTTSSNIEFDRSFPDCLTKVIKGEAQVGIITNDISMEDIKKVCYSGSTMPQKSTYFFPKVVCGFLFSSIKEDEFQSPVNASL